MYALYGVGIFALAGALYYFKVYRPSINNVVAPPMSGPKNGPPNSVVPKWKRDGNA